MCSTVASSPILAVQLAERALTVCNYSQNHLSALFVNVIASASAGAAQHGTCGKSISVNPYGFLYVPEWLKANFLLALPHWVQYSPGRCTHCSLQVFMLASRFISFDCSP